MVKMTGRYYASRLIKYGFLSYDDIKNIIISSEPYEEGKIKYQIIEPRIIKFNGMEVIYGELVRYLPRYTIHAVDEERREEIDKEEENIIEAKAPFVYIDDYSSIFHLNVWNFISHKKFRKVFRNIISNGMKKNGKIMYDIFVEPISDDRIIYEKIKNVHSFHKIKSVVFPTNPFYRDLWKQLDEYLKKRESDKISIEESSSHDSGIKTNIKNINQMSKSEICQFVDMAILMAIDGYGHAIIKGKSKDGKILIINTRDNDIFFEYYKDPDPQALANKAISFIDVISRKRGLKHKK